MKYDVSNVEGGNFEQAKPGLYNCKINEVEAGPSKAGNAQLKVVFKIVGGEFDGSNLFHYVPTEPDAPGAFRMKEFVKALGLKKDRGVIDVDKLVGTAVQVSVKADSYEGEYKARVGKVMPAKEAEEDDEDLDDEDLEDEADKADEADEVDYGEMSMADLRTEAKARGLAVAAALKGRKTAADKKDGLIDLLEQDDEEEPEEEEEDVEEEEAEDDGYDDLSVDDLKGELKERGLKVVGKRAILIGRLRKDDESDEDPFA